ncbi:hypothetical protein GCM10009641_86940 [Mycobacterium cookii]|uniref:Uncharacterized protein n=1 Tax=Nocardioides furvisabuli TaxID=375542 RepID=A0ABN2WVN1_9ACTN|nr:hypothetical protein [Nocardioides furvisabuli]
MTTGAWVADPTVAWVIALEAHLREPVDVEQVAAGLASAGLPGPVVTADRGPDALQQVLAPRTAAVRAAVSTNRVVLGAQHERCDGLGLLALLEAATGAAATSSARGLGERDVRGSALGSTARRLAEALLSPPAPVAAPAAAGRRDAGEAFARFTVARRLPVAELTHAAVQGVTAHNRAVGGRTTRVAVAIGASRLGGEVPVVGDHSALLRLRGVERLSVPEVRAAIREAAPEPPPPGTGDGPSLTGRVATVAMGALSSRLGSTLLVSHLGDVDAPQVEELAFYPVTAGGSGVSVGAVGLRGTTVVTLRGRGHRHPSATLEALGRRVHDALEATGS